MPKRISRLQLSIEVEAAISARDGVALKKAFRRGGRFEGSEVNEAASRDDARTVEFLLDHGAAEAWGGRTALHSAAWAQSVECVRLLAKRSPRLAQERDWVGRTPMMLALDRDSLEIIRALAPISDLHATDDNGVTPLTWPCGPRAKAVVEAVELSRVERAALEASAFEAAPRAKLRI